MTTEGVLSIQAVRKRTGLTARALRFYEARGLVEPIRSTNGGRYYGAEQLARLQHLLVLKRAGFTLEHIRQVLAGRLPDLSLLVGAQIAALEQAQQSIVQSLAALRRAQTHLAAGGTADVETLCNIIHSGDQAMNADAWKKVADTYFSADEQAKWAERMAQTPAGFDPAAYQRQWQELAAKIESALPLDPASPDAQALLDEWRKLLEPFSRVATPEMMSGATQLYDRMHEWSGDVKPPFSAAVWEFIKAAGRARG